MDVYDPARDYQPAITFYRAAKVPVRAHGIVARVSVFVMLALAIVVMLLMGGA